jgi:hypothetical protein
MPSASPKLVLIYEKYRSKASSESQMKLCKRCIEHCLHITRLEVSVSAGPGLTGACFSTLVAHLTWAPELKVFRIARPKRRDAAIMEAVRDLTNRREGLVVDVHHTTNDHE